MENVSIAEHLAQALVGLPVAHSWQGHGSAIFLELGSLSVRESHVSLPGRETRVSRRPKGEVTIMIEWSWRVEGPRSVVFGSFSGERKVSKGLAGLVGRHVESANIVGRLPELCVSMSGGRWLHSFSTVEGQPKWAVLLPDGQSIGVHRGVAQLAAADAQTAEVRS